ncbi:MAG: bifunctional transaldolase/phosoglucose isomerase [Candidatus Dormibacteraceae bacterium]
MNRAANPLQELHKQGQSLWYDNIRRQLITSGELARLRDEGVTGVTSNPTIYEKAVSGSTDYDEGLNRLTAAGRKPGEMLWDLMVEDIQAAADVFRPVHDSTRGKDGFVSIEVSPDVALNTKKTVAMARELWKRCERPNVMVKIPATREGLPAIRTMIGEGVNINVTLIFSVQRYTEVVEAFLSGLEDLKRKGGDLDKVNSVASFFVSRVDSKIDKLLAAKIAAIKDPKEARRLERLYGKAGIANSKMAYERFKVLHSGPRWEVLAKAGAAPQRCLWASTSVKDPRYTDTMYVEELIGPDTVDTVPPNTLAAFREHGEVRRSLDEHVDAARRQLKELAEAGIDLDEVTRELEVEGVDSFFKSYESLGKVLTEAARAIKKGAGPRQWHALGTLQPDVDGAVKQLTDEGAPRRLWAKDGTLWTGDAADWLGWLNVVEKMESKESELHELARAAKTYSDVVLLGMGGSSLGPDVLLHTFGRVAGHPRLHVLDTTDPATIAATTREINLASTLFVVASKSGGTTETLSHFAHFWALVAAGSKKPGRQFLAITDPGTSLEKLARAHDFRWVFRNMPDIGGRYSVLSYFGMVPAALAGYDFAKLLDRATEMANACAADIPAEKNPGVWLGAVLGALAQGHKRDKLTLILSARIGSFGYWVEQLIAESTGKLGRGIVPIEGEPLGTPADYGADRLFVHVRMASDPEHPGVRALEGAGQPVVTLTLRDKLDIGGEFLRWEIATAIAGSLLKINAFDQPNVQESKDNTKKVLGEYAARGSLPTVATVAADGAAPALKKLLGGLKPARSYFAIMSYTGRTAGSERALTKIRTAVRDGRKVATTVGYGPRFLHSTGQLHKGGPAEGVFLQIVEDDRIDVPIPGQKYGFSTLKQAQAIGDLRSLESRRLPVLRVTLGTNHTKGWAALVAAVESALGQ